MKEKSNSRHRKRSSKIFADSLQPSKLVVGSARPADIPQLVGLLHLLFAQEADFEPDSRKQRQAIRMLMKSTSAALFVAREANRVVGMISVLFTISTAEGGVACWIEDMIVLPAYRRRGVGSELLRRAVSHARSRGAKRLTLLTDRTNGSAQRFYLRHGFTRSHMVPLRLHVGRAARS